MKKKICFVLSVSTGIIGYGSLFSTGWFKNNDDLKNYFSKDYDVSLNYYKDKDAVDYLVVPDPFFPFDNENKLPVIKVPARLFMTKDFNEIQKYIEFYFVNNG